MFLLEISLSPLAQTEGGHCSVHPCISIHEMQAEQRELEASGFLILTLVLLLYSWQVQNGLALYATWTTIATLLNFAIVLIYKWDVSNETATTASLSILTLMLVMW